MSQEQKRGSCTYDFQKITEVNLADKKVMKKISKAISRKRIRTGCIAVAAVLALAAAVFYFGFVKDYYVSYENSGLRIENGSIMANEIGHIYGMYPENGEAGFFYVARSLYDQYIAPKHMNTVPLVKNEYLFDYLTFTEGENYTEDQYRVKELYYVPRAYIFQVRHAEDFNIEELKSVSQLVWSAQ